ncbi:MAG: glycosyltransferase [Bacteroidales bacterium]|nr:glycosyltransferase [Bacteroidales bacterium]
MNLCLCFGYFPETIEEDIISNTKCYLQNSANVLQKKFIEGIACYFKSFTIINAPFVGYYPLKYRSIYVPKTYFQHKEGNATIDVRSYSFNTLPYLTHKERKYKCKREVSRWLYKHQNENDENVVIVYSMHMNFILACAELKKKYRFKLITIIPDLPKYFNTSGKWYSILHQKINNLMKKDYVDELNCIDGFVYLTEYMNREICKEERPYVVIEGMVSYKSAEESHIHKHEKFILYTGTMARKYGVMNLVEAFTIMKHNKDYKLCLCGYGDCISEIQHLSREYNIDYKGEISNKEVLDLQKKAALLINPRVNEGEYVKFSFPSKVMEYFVSGTPVLMHKLDGIPLEYYDYCFTFNGTKLTEIAQQIDEVLDIKESERLFLAEKANRFILDEKNSKIQCKKLVELIKIILNKHENSVNHI